MDRQGRWLYLQMGFDWTLVCPGQSWRTMGQKEMSSSLAPRCSPSLKLQPKSCNTVCLADFCASLSNNWLPGLSYNLMPVFLGTQESDMLECILAAVLNGPGKDANLKAYLVWCCCRSRRGRRRRVLNEHWGDAHCSVSVGLHDARSAVALNWSVHLSYHHQQWRPLLCSNELSIHHHCCPTTTTTTNPTFG